MSEQFEKLILRALDKLSLDDKQKEVVLNVDALDECIDTYQQSKILKLLSRLHQNGLKRLSTSLQETKIIAHFKRTRHASCKLDEYDTFGVEKGIRVVLRDDIKAFLLCDWTGDDGLKRLVSIESLLFIAATTFLSMIKDGKWAESPDYKLQAIFNSSTATISNMQAVSEPVVTRMGNVVDNFQLDVGSIICLAKFPPKWRGLQRSMDCLLLPSLGQLVRELD
ncbi:hypothetical protein FCULG_00001897 [Fusarium culmorum]|uniref:Uncharacterized protein n=1 Tax=Fusarium culmorum TaxID=5516 RepID=A0A2T4GQG0_FUSCU|nr:hypothetical protein FCULG_00001897 [Fusarium culmorum]